VVGEHQKKCQKLVVKNLVNIRKVVSLGLTKV